MAVPGGLVTRTDLHEVFADLPAPHPDTSHLVAPVVSEFDRAQVHRAGGIGYVAALAIAALLVGVPAAVVVGMTQGQWAALAGMILLTVVLFAGS